MIRETRVPSIPEVRDDNVLDVLRSIKTVLEVREGALGDPLDQSATLRDLTDLNLAASGTTTTATGGKLPVIPTVPPLALDGYDPATDYTTPPAPTNLIARGGLTNVHLSWDGAPYRNHSYTEIWRAYSDNLGRSVLIGTTAANVYADPAQEDTEYFYWIRFVSVANVTGPYNATSGTQAKTAIRVSSAITALSSEIQRSSLFIDLGTRIQRIENANVLSGEQISVLNDTKDRLEQAVSANGSAIETTQVVTARSATQINALASELRDPVTGLTQTRADLINLYYTKVDADSAIAGQVSVVSARLNSIDGNGVTLEQNFSAQADAITGLNGKYTVKIDNNGHVSGFGLASEANNGTAASSFIVRADKFALASPTDTTNPLGTTSPTQASTPFMVFTTPTNVTINGQTKTYPAGVWMNSAFIANATIDSAQISSITADQITTGSLTATLGITSGKVYGGVNPAYTFASANFGTGFYLGNDGGTYKFFVGSPSQNMQWTGSSLSVTGNINALSGTFRNITVYDSNDNVILSSGGVNTSLLGLGDLATLNTVTTAQVTGLGDLATQSTVTTGQVTGLGSLATQNSVTTGQVTGLGGLATQDSVFVGSTVKFADGTVMGTGDFVSKLTKIGTGNISTFIDGAAITNAYIGNAAISTAKIENLAVTNAKINDLSVSKLTAGSLSASQYIQSSNYSAGGNGFKINADGTAEFGQVTVRGNITANALVANTVTTSSISGAAVTSVTTNSTTGSSLSQSVYVPANTSAVVVLANLGPGEYVAYGEGTDYFRPATGNLEVNGSQVVTSATAAIVWSQGNPSENGGYTVTLVRTQANVGLMTLTVMVCKR